MQLSRSFGAPPVRGGLVEQPLGLLIVGRDLMVYEHAFREVEAADRENRHADSAALALVMETTAAAIART